VIPEAPLPVLLPLTALVAMAGTFVVRLVRRTATER
jgi:hypothetical protein